MFKSIRAKIAILAIVPLCAFAIAEFIAINEASTQSRLTAELLPISKVAEKSEGVLHELQKERGRTAVMLASGYADKPRALLEEQRGASDKALEALRQTVDGFSISNDKLLNRVQEVTAGLDAIADHRQGIDGKKVDGGANLKFYSGKISELIELVQAAVQASSDNEYAGQMGPFLALTEAIEAGGLERAIGGQLFAIVGKTGEVPSKRFLAYHDRLSVETAFLKKFQQISTPEQRSLFEATVAGPEVDQVMAWRDVLATLPETRNGHDIDGSVWFGKATVRLGQIRTASLEMLKSAQARAVEIADAAAGHLWFVLAETMVVVVITLAVCVWIIRDVNGLIARLTSCLVRISDGDVEFEMPFSDRQDPIGDLARAGVVFQENARVRQSLEAEASKELDRERQRQNHVEDLITKFKMLMNDVTAKVNSRTGEMTDTATRVRDISHEASGAAASAKDASVSSSTNVQTVAAAAEEMSAAIQEIMNQAERASNVISDANGVALRTDASVSSLAEAVEKIGTVVEMIRAIAEQTNLLALNATIEAARAGDAGKGFAVVAAEVKELSTQTAKATEEISSQISSVQGLTNDAVESIRRISTSIEEINEVTGAINGAVSEQNIATQEISQSITRASTETSSAVSNAEAVDQSIQATAQQAETVDRLAVEVKEVTAQMATGIEGFLQEMSSDVEERRRASRKQETGQAVTLTTHEGKQIKTRLLNSSDGGIGLKYFEGAREGMIVSYEDPSGTLRPMEIKWVRNDTVGLQYRAAGGFGSVAA